MNIAVIGATGATGLRFVEQALQRGHCVSVLVRSPEKLTIQHPNLKVQVGSILNPADVARVATGQDGVFIALGTGKAPKKSSIRTDGTQQIVDVLTQAGAKTAVVALSSLGVGESNRQMAFYWRWVLGVILFYVFKDHLKQETILRQSGLPHAIVRPTFMNDNPPTGTINDVTPAAPVRTAKSVSRADVAGYALTLIESGQLNGQAVTLTG